MLASLAERIAKSCLKKNYSERWITRLACRRRTQPAARINVNCRTPRSSTFRTHIAGRGHSSAHACPRVGNAKNYVRRPDSGVDVSGASKSDCACLRSFCVAPSLDTLPATFAARRAQPARRLHPLRLHTAFAARAGCLTLSRRANLPGCVATRPSMRSERRRAS